MVGVLIIGLIIYKSMYTNLYGFTLKRSNIESVLVYTANHGYEVKNKKLVDEIVSKTAKMKRSKRINPATFPEYKVHSPLTDFVIQTKDHSQYGGSIWREDASLVNANGYYWKLTPELLQLLKKAIQDKQTITVF